MTLSACKYSSDRWVFLECEPEYGTLSYWFSDATTGEQYNCHLNTGTGVVTVHGEDGGYAPADIATAVEAHARAAFPQQFNRVAGGV